MKFAPVRGMCTQDITGVASLMDSKTLWMQVVQAIHQHCHLAATGAFITRIPKGMKLFTTGLKVADTALV